MRRLLCVFPRYTPSFGSFEFSYPLTEGIRAFMPAGQVDLYFNRDISVFIGQKMIAEEPKVIDQSLQEAETWADKLSGDIMSRMREEMKKRGHDI